MTILCEPDREVAAALVAHIAGRVHTVTSLHIAAVALAAAEPDKELLVIGAGIDVEQAMHFATALRIANLAAGVILLDESPDAALRDRAAGHGIHEVVAANDGAALADACHRFRTRVVSHVAGRSGRTITVFSAKGGCGKTTLATNLAVALNAGGTKSVCLVDLDLGFGDVANSLRLEPLRSLADAVALTGKLSGDTIPALVTPYSPGLDCILAPVGPGEAERIPATLVTDLLTALPAIYDFIVVDAPAKFSEHVLAALDNSDHLVLLTTPEIPTLRNLRLTLDTLDLLSCPRGARSIVFNRADSQVGLAAADIETIVKSPITTYIPSSKDVPASINRGVPIVAAQPEHPVSVAVRQLAEELRASMQPAGSWRPGSSDLRRWGST